MKMYSYKCSFYSRDLVPFQQVNGNKITQRVAGLRESPIADDRQTPPFCLILLQSNHGMLVVVRVVAISHLISEYGFRATFVTTRPTSVHLQFETEVCAAAASR
jgi:hypothetical protein